MKVRVILIFTVIINHVSTKRNGDLYSFFTDYIEEYNEYLDSFTILLNQLYKYYFTDFELQSKISSMRQMESFTPGLRKIQAEGVGVMSEVGDSPTSSDVLLEKYSRSCGANGNLIAYNTSMYNCNGSQVDKETFDREANCTADNDTILFCACPRTYDNCFELTNEVLCSFKELYAQDINLLLNKDTFYFEYFNRSELEFDNKPIEFQAKFKCGNRFPINQTDLIAVEETEYLDIITNKTYDSIDKDGNILHQTKLDFKYFINEDNITLLNKPDLKLSLTFYNMKSLMPGIKLLYKVDEEKIKEVLKGEESVSFLLDLNKPIPSNSTIIFDSLDELITAGRLFYEIKLENSLENDINTLVYQGSIELNARVKLMDTSYAPFFVILTLLSSLVVFLFILKKIKEGNFKSRKEKFKGEIQLKEYN